MSQNRDILLQNDRAKHFLELGSVTFPSPTDINVNMMPFEVEPNFPTIPEVAYKLAITFYLADLVVVQEYRGYIPMIVACCRSLKITDHLPNKSNKKPKKKPNPLIFYLTIQESFVESGVCQRRPGLHTDAHANADWGAVCSKGDGDCEEPNVYNSWGAGRYEEEDKEFSPSGGIFLASTIPGSSAVWDCALKTPGLLGDCEDLRDRLYSYGPTELEANHLYWITDRTPHEALPMPASGLRQFFRLVTEKVDVWYEQHSTPNPMGVTPPPSCKIISENKFGVLLK
jgi:hypothetical protein